MNKVLVFFLGFLSCLVLWGQQNKIVSVTFSGLKRTQGSYLERFLKVKEGDVVDTLALVTDAQCLRNLRLFSTIHYELKDTTGGQVAVFHCKEQWTLLPYINAGWSSSGFQLSLGAFDYHSFGRGVFLKAIYHYYQRHSLELAYRNPFHRSHNWGYGLEFARQNTIEPLYFSLGKSYYNFSTWKFGADWQYQLAFNHKIGLGAMYLIEDFKKNEAHNTMLTGDVPGPSERAFKKSLLKVYHQINRINYRYPYQSGFANKTFVEFTYAMPNGQWFYKIQNEFTWFRQIGPTQNIAVRSVLGIGHNRYDPFPVFVHDNYVNVRGVGDRIARGTAQVTFNVELRQTLYDIDWFSAQILLFSDFSSLRPSTQPLHTLLEKNNQQWFSGLGIRLSLDNYYESILRVDYGWNTTNVHLVNGGIVIGIGQYF